MAASTLIAVALCGKPGCTFAQWHQGGCSFEMRLGKRARKSVATKDLPSPAKKPAAAAAAASDASASESAVKEDYVHTRGRKWNYWPHHSRVPKNPPRNLTNKVVVPAGLNLPANMKYGSAEVKIMNLTAAYATGADVQDEDDESRPRWGGSCSVPCGELDGINHNRPSDNIDVMIICLRDQLTGDIYVFKHVINLNHEYIFGHGTFRTLNPRPRVGKGDFMPPRHRPIVAMEEWIKLLTEWSGGAPILIMHFHPAMEDATWDAERPVAPEGVPIVYGVGCGIQAPSHAEQTHAFLRKRLAKYGLPRVDENPLGVFDGTTIIDRTISSRMNARVQAFDSIFAGGDNTPFGELGCAIAQDALLKDGAAAAARHPNSHWHYDLLFAYPRT